jgi:hypothetical protein
MSNFRIKILELNSGEKGYIPQFKSREHLLIGTKWVNIVSGYTNKSDAFTSVSITEIHSTEEAAISIIENYKVVIDENYKKKAKKITYKKLKL